LGKLSANICQLYLPWRVVGLDNGTFAVRLANGCRNPGYSFDPQMKLQNTLLIGEKGQSPEPYQSSIQEVGKVTMKYNVKRNITITLAAVAVMTFSGCLPMSIAHNADRHNWAEINLEREKAGLKPLTWDEYHQPHSL
jgi:hypothetical protein